ncbi:MAG: hypothetical protein ABI642_18560, partial [Polaromonas sp.]
AAQTTQVSLQRERLSAWVALYRAMGGGWTRALPETGHQGKANAATEATAAVATFVPPAASSQAPAAAPVRR